jgi:hypothetical protein
MAFLRPLTAIKTPQPAPVAPLADRPLAESGWAGPHSTGLSIALNNSTASMRMTFVSVTSGGSGSLGEAHVDTPFMKKVLYITKRKRKSNIHHYCKSDDFRAGFKVAEWGMFCH